MVATSTVHAGCLANANCQKLTWVVLLQSSGGESLIKARSWTYPGKPSSLYLALKLVLTLWGALVRFQHLNRSGMNHTRLGVGLLRQVLQNS